MSDGEERRAPAREVHCADAIEWLGAREVLAGCSVITSLPDVSETPRPFPEWRQWFIDSAALVMSRCPSDGVAIFYQTDIKVAGRWVDKGYLCQRGAETAGLSLLWHKIVCRRPPGMIGYGRPAYAHMLCFSRGVTTDPSRSTPDVLPGTGRMTWSRAMGLDACSFACRWVLEHTATRTVVDPFCGHGSVLAVANELGLDAIGVDLSRRRCAKARSLSTATRTRERPAGPPGGAVAGSVPAGCGVAEGRDVTNGRAVTEDRERGDPIDGESSGPRGAGDE